MFLFSFPFFITHVTKPSFQPDIVFLVSFSLFLPHPQLIAILIHDH